VWIDTRDSRDGRKAVSILYRPVRLLFFCIYVCVGLTFAA